MTLTNSHKNLIIRRFIENAPEELVEEQKELVAEKQAARDKFSAALEQLEAA